MHHIGKASGNARYWYLLCQKLHCHTRTKIHDGTLTNKEKCGISQQTPTVTEICVFGYLGTSNNHRYQVLGTQTTQVPTQ